MNATIFELMRGDVSRAAPNAIELARLTREHDLSMWQAYAVFLEGLTKAESGAPGGLEDMRRGTELLRETNVLVYDGLVKIAHAGAEARAGHVDRALAILDEALATADRIGHRAYVARLLDLSGDVHDDPFQCDERV